MEGKKQLIELLKLNSIEEDTIDIDAEWDASLTDEENINHFIHKYHLSDGNDVSKKILEEQIGRYESEARHQEEEHFKKELERSIEDIKNTVDTETYGFYGNLKHLISMLNTGFTKSVFVIGGSGLGKTTVINAMLDEKAVRIGGHITPKKLYELLYKYREDKVIFFDDTESMLNHGEVMPILKQALDTVSVRNVSWQSSTKMDLPNNFNFKSRVVFCLNGIPQDEGLKAIVNRSDYIEIDMDYKTILKLMYKIAKNPRKVNDVALKPKDRLMIVDYIKENVDECVDNFSLRTQYKIENYFAYAPDSWKELANGLLSNRNKYLDSMKRVIKNGYSVMDQIEEYRKQTGRSRASYFRDKQEYMKRCGNATDVVG